MNFCGSAFWLVDHGNGGHPPGSHTCGGLTMATGSVMRLLLTEEDDSKRGEDGNGEAAKSGRDQADLSYVLVIDGIADRVANLLQGKRFGDDIADDF